jgi:hypothetical protein
LDCKVSTAVLAYTNTTVVVVAVASTYRELAEKMQRRALEAVTKEVSGLLGLVPE